MRFDSPAMREALDNHIEGRFRGDDEMVLCRGCDGFVYVNEGRYCAECIAIREQEEDEDADPQAP